MKSRVLFWLDQNNQAVIKADVVPNTDEIRDVIAQRFMEGFGQGSSNLAYVSFEGHTMYILPINLRNIPQSVIDADGPAIRAIMDAYALLRQNVPTSDTSRDLTLRFVQDTRTSGDPVYSLGGKLYQKNEAGDFMQVAKGTIEDSFYQLSQGRQVKTHQDDYTMLQALVYGYSYITKCKMEVKPADGNRYYVYPDVGRSFTIDMDSYLSDPFTTKIKKILKYMESCLKPENPKPDPDAENINMEKGILICPNHGVWMLKHGEVQYSLYGIIKDKKPHKVTQMSSENRSLWYEFLLDHKDKMVDFILNEEEVEHRGLIKVAYLRMEVEK